MYLLDTNICSYLLRQRPAQVTERFQALAEASLAMSEITFAELTYGAEHHPSRTAELKSAIEELRARVQVLPWTAAREYGRLRNQLEALGRPMGHMDLMIAAHALALDATLVTNDRADFIHVPGIRLENWV